MIIDSNESNFQVKWASYGSIGALVFYMCVYGVGSPIPWMITGELFTTQVSLILFRF